jgi:hypothetical protein
MKIKPYNGREKYFKAMYVYPRDQGQQLIISCGAFDKNTFLTQIMLLIEKLVDEGHSMNRIVHAIIMNIGNYVQYYLKISTYSINVATITSFLSKFHKLERTGYNSDHKHYIKKKLSCTFTTDKEPTLEFSMYGIQTHKIYLYHEKYENQLTLEYIKKSLENFGK